MISSSNAYYLQTMGIDLWLYRDLLESHPLLNVIAPQHTPISVMIVLEDAAPDAAKQWLTGKVGSLLTKMLRSIGLSPNNTAILYGVAAKTEEEFQTRDALLTEQVTRLKPKLMLLLGSFVTQCSHSIPIISGDHPMDLLNDPIKKKKAFVDWVQVKEMLD